MDLSHYLAGGAIIGLLATWWARLQALCWRIANLFVRQVAIQDEHTQLALIDYLVLNYPRSSSYDKMYGSCNEHSLDGKFGLVPFEVLGRKSIIFWRGWMPFFYSTGPRPATTTGTTTTTNTNNQDKVFCTLTFIRGTVDAEKLVTSACDARNKATWDVDSTHKSRQRRFFIKHVPAVGAAKANSANSTGTANVAWYHQARYRLLKHQPHELGKQIIARRSPLESLIFPRRVKELIREIRVWRSSKNWYQQRGIPWKRGWMCFGPPGTGKTALARAFAEELDMPLYVFNLAELSNHELIEAWADMQTSSPCVALIEDIDNVFHGRENIARPRFALFGRKKKKQNDNKEDDGDGDGMSGGMLSFDCLLNCLDGVERSEGVFTVITTNDVSKIDAALAPRKLPDGTVEFISTRPGRIDKAVELTYMEPNDKKMMAARILDEYEEEYLALLQFVDRFPDLQETPAQFQERCAQAALARFWREQQEKQEKRPPEKRTEDTPREELVEVG